MKMKVFDDTVLVSIVRDGANQEVMFNEILEGDVLKDGTVVGTDSHFSGDESYDGYLFYDTEGNDYYPEDFGGELIYDPDEDDDEDEW